MSQWFVEKLYRPMLFFFLLPFFSISLGSTFALQYNPLHLVSFICLYVFILVNQMLENILLRIPVGEFEVSKGFTISLEFVNVLLLLYFGWQHSWLAALVLFFYTLIIQVQFIFSYYELETVAAFIAAILKTFLLNAFAFYIHTNFIDPQYLPTYLGLFIPFFLFEISRTEWKPRRQWLLTLTLLSGLIGLFLLWPMLGWESLLLLLAFPAAGLFRTEFSRKTTALFALVYSLVFILLIFFLM